MKAEDGGSSTSGYQAPIFDTGIYTLRAKNGPGSPWIGSSTGLLNTSTDYHVIIIIDGSTSKCYVNGVLVLQNTVSGASIGSNVENLIFGHNNWLTNGTSIAYNGVLDDIGIWNRVLTDCEIQELYNAEVNIDNSVTQSNSVLTSNQSNATYQWLDCDNDNAIIVGEINQYYTPIFTGNYAVEINMNGCVDTSSCYLIDYANINTLSIESKQLIKIVDFMGRETKPINNRAFIFIYSDGSREVVCRFE